MKLTRLSILGFARLPDLELTVGHSDDRGSITVVSGPPASGKTALLDILIAAKETWGPLGARVPWSPKSRDGQGAKLTANWAVDRGTLLEAEAIFDSATAFAGAVDDRLSSAVSGYSLSPGLWKLEYAHEGRRLGRGVALHSMHRAGARVEIDDQKYAGLEPLLLARLTDPLALPLLNQVLSGFGLEVKVTPRGALAVRTPRGEQPVSALSSSEQQMFLLFAGPLALGMDNALLLVDTLEQGLPAAWSAQVIGALRQLLPTGQIIATTRAPELAVSADFHIQLR